MKKLQAAHAEKLSETDRKEAITKALNKGFQALENWWYADKSDVPPKYHTHFETLEKLLGDLYKAQNPPPKSHILDIAKGYQEATAALHKDQALSTADKVFLEFMLGLWLVMPIIAAANHHMVFKMLPEETARQLLENSPFNTPLSSSKAIGPQLVTKSLEIEAFNHQVTLTTHNEYKGKSHEYWDKGQDALDDRELADIFHRIVGMRYFPSIEDQDGRTVVALHQWLHWRGFGGKGEWLEEVMGKNEATSKLKIFPRPDLLLRNCLAWHPEEGEGQVQSHMATVIGDILRPPISEARTHGTEIAVKALTKTFPDDKTLRVIDCGSGPVLAAVLPIINQVASKSSHQDHTTLVYAGDISEDSMHALQTSPPTTDHTKLTIKAAEAQNLLTLDPHTDKIALQVQEDGRVHLLSFGVCLHQTMDSLSHPELTKAELRNKFRYAANVLQPNGYLLIVDAGIGVTGESLTITYNLTDREGSVPEKICSFLGGNPRIQTPDGTVEFRPVPGAERSVPEKGKIYTVQLFQMVQVES